MEKTLSALRSIWAAIFFAQGPMFFVLYRQPNAFFDFSQGIPKPQLMFVFAALSSLTLSMIIPKKFLVQNLKNYNTDVYMGKIKKDMTPPILEKLFVPFVVRLALLETIAIFGYITATFTKNLYHYLCFACIMLITHALSFPSKRFLTKFSGGYQFN